MKITKDMLIGEVIEQGNREEIAAVLLGMGMHCLGCAIAHGETVEDELPPSKRSGKWKTSGFSQVKA